MPRHDASDSIRTAIESPGKLSIPFGFNMRSYQAHCAQAVDNGATRAITVWHRRSGKDIFWLNQMLKAMVLAPYCGTYLYIFPHLTQGRRDLWDAKTSPDSGGRPFRSFIPPQLVMESSETEMQLTLKPMPHQKPQAISDGRGGSKRVGSVFQVMGADKDSMENMRGMNAIYAVFSEFADQNEGAWTNIIEPMLLENKGRAAFNFTPKGKNHAYTLYEFARQAPTWYTSLQTITDTRRDAEGEDGSRIVTDEQIQELRARGVAEEIIQQEYYCSFDGFLQGTIYGDLVKRAQQEGRITRVPHDTNLPVGTMWDIGRTDATAIWFYQVHGPEIRFIDYYANRKQGADHYAKVCRDKPYLYAKMMLPHDATVTGYTATENTLEFLSRTVCRHCTVVPKTSLQTGVDMTRRLFSRFVFDSHHCDTPPSPGLQSGLEGLRSYRRAFNADHNEYSGDYVHDQHSHPADALRTGATGWEEGLQFMDTQSTTILEVESKFDPRAVTR